MTKDGMKKRGKIFTVCVENLWKEGLYIKPKISNISTI